MEERGLRVLSATTTNERDLKWKGRDIMRGFGINNPHHVSSSVSFKEMNSRAYGKAYVEALRKSGVRTRFTEDGVDGLAMPRVPPLKVTVLFLASASFFEGGVCYNAPTKRTLYKTQVMTGTRA